MESDYEGEESFTQGDVTQNNVQLAKKLVRYALACEYARHPIRRADISQKILGSQSRQFKAVFDEAQLTLRDTFGMEMVELPPNERVTLAQRKKAIQKAQSQTQSQQTSTKSWRLATTLPEKFRDPTIIQPPQAPSVATESEYVGFYTFVIALIALNDGVLPHERLERQLRRTYTEQYTPVDKTDKLFLRLQREGYVVKVTQKDSAGEETVEWMIGPRGKTEVDRDSVITLVKMVYGPDAPEDLDQRLDKSLGAQRMAANEARGTNSGTAGDASNGKRKRGRLPQQQRRAEDVDQSVSEEEDD